MKKFCFVFSIIMILLFSTSCRKVSADLELAVCGSYAVPGMMCYDLKGGSHQCEIIEKDSEGRILFRYTANNFITEKTETAYIICQIIDNDSVFYYEDVCYLFETGSASSIMELKEANDWDQELDINKMSERPINISVDLCLVTESRLDHRTIQDKYCQTMELEQSQIREFVLIDVAPTGQELYYIELEMYAGAEKYILLCDQEYNISTQHFSGNIDNYEQISTFKKSYGWGT